MTTRHLSMLAVIGAVAAFVVVGCGSDDSGGSTTGGGGDTSSSSGGGAYGGGSGGTKAAPGGGETLRLSADPGGALKFDKSTLDAKAGNVTIDFDNPSSATAPHAVEVEGNGVEDETETIQPGNKSSVTIKDLKPGTYEFYCPVDGHKQAGMEGTLTVK